MDLIRGGFCSKSISVVEGRQCDLMYEWQGDCRDFICLSFPSAK